MWGSVMWFPSLGLAMPLSHMVIHPLQTDPAGDFGHSTHYWADSFHKALSTPAWLSLIVLINMLRTSHTNAPPMLSYNEKSNGFCPKASFSCLLRHKRIRFDTILAPAN